MIKGEWLLLLNILDTIAKRLPHGGSETKEEKDLAMQLKNLRDKVKRIPY